MLGTFTLQAGYLGFGTTGGPSFAEILPNELLFWLAHSVFVVPACWILVRQIALGWRRLPEKLNELATLHGAEARATLLAGSVLLGLLYLAGRWLILRELPATDDENAVLFGARILADGHLRIPSPAPEGAFYLLYLTRKDGQVGSMDFPGPLFFRALSLVLPAGEVIYPALAAVTGALLIATADRLVGGQFRLVAAGLWTLSPMAFFLSLTTHAHLLSRAFLALALWGWSCLRTKEEPERLGAVALGVGAGLALLCRPFESTAMLLGLVPVLFRPGPHRRHRVLLALMASLPSLLLFAAYNRATTGIWYLPARYAPGATAFSPLEELSLPARLAVNSGYNALMLAQLAATPLLLPLLALGARSSHGRPLLASLTFSLALGLGHENTGIHSLGPIHYSEVILPLILLAVLGLQEAESLTSSFQALRQLIHHGTTALLLSLPIFNLVHGWSLRRQANLQQLPFEILANAGFRRAVVVAPPPAQLYEQRPELRRDVPWVLYYPPPDPSLRDDLIFAKPTADLEALRARFPDRPLVRLSYPPSGPLFSIELIAPPSAPLKLT
ncbi:MAG: glycosyltransferase family 39 protein [Myxococcales bacterium]|nr:glycosyltransferase family 39 protein [Polyangiaceae bacterium]MDW8251597.1 glycosyltransferase family 39 protein [Myxococcales bacterium]